MKQQLSKPKIGIIFLIFMGLASNVFSACQVQYTGKAAQMFGSTPRGSFKDINECNNYKNSRPIFESSNSRCVGCSSGSQSNSFGGYSGGNQGAKNLMMNSFTDMLGNLLTNTLNPVQQESNIQYQNNLLRKQKQAAIKKEQERKKSLAKWGKIKNEQKNQIVKEEKEKREGIKDLLIQMKPIGSYDKFDFDGTGLNNSDNELKLLPIDLDDTSELTSVDNAINNDNSEIGLVPLDISSDPFLAPGVPIDGLNLTEHGQINRIIDESKYAHMEPKELIALKNLTNNEEIQSSINKLLVRKKAISKLEYEVEKIFITEDIKNISEKQAEEEVKRALKEVPGILGVPVGVDIVEWIDKKTNTSSVTMLAGKEIVTEEMKDFVIAMYPKLEKTVARSAIGLSYVGKAKHLYKFYVAVDKAGDHYVDAAEAGAYLQASEEVFHMWKGAKDNIHKESARLYNLIEKEEKKYDKNK